MKSSPRSLKSEEAELETKSDDDKLGVTDTELGANVVSSSPDSNSGTIEVSSDLRSIGKFMSNSSPLLFSPGT